MYVFVSWAYTQEAQEAEQRRLAWVEQLKQTGREALASKLTAEFCLPEYFSYTQVNAEPSDGNKGMDELNANLLSIRFVAPSLEKIVTYQLAKRLPGSGKLPVSLAARSFLLNSFEGEWLGESSSGGLKRITFVGLTGLTSFLESLALSCAVLHEPLPYDLWKSKAVIELPADEKLRKLIDVCAGQCKDEKELEKYQSLILGWLGTGASAERDSAIAVTAGLKLGLKSV